MEPNYKKKNYFFKLIPRNENHCKFNNNIFSIQKLWNDKQAHCSIKGFPIVPNVHKGLQFESVTTYSNPNKQTPILICGVVCTPCVVK
jgi:hypothetical protein